MLHNEPRIGGSIVRLNCTGGLSRGEDIKRALIEPISIFHRGMFYEGKLRLVLPATTIATGRNVDPCLAVFWVGHADSEKEVLEKKRIRSSSQVILSLLWAEARACRHKRLSGDSPLEVKCELHNPGTDNSCGTWPS